MSTDIIQIDLTLAERHTLHDLLTNYIDERVFEDVKFARYSMDLEKAAQRAHRLALVKGLAEDSGELPLADLDALREELTAWAKETDGTADEHDEQIAKADDPETDWAERAEKIGDLRRMTTVDYAHQCV